MNITFLVASARANGNSEQLARHAAETLPDTVEQSWIALRDHPLDPFQDLRHVEGSGYEEPTGHAKTLADATLAADHIVLVTPVYWYSVPAPLKLYLDYWSHWMRVESLDFKAKMSEKSLRVISALAGPAESAEPMTESLKLCAAFLSMNWGGYALGNGSAPGDVLQDENALRAATQCLTKILTSG